jgi:hypothetical protein
MHIQKLCLPAIVFATLFLAADFASALGFQLGETKEQLKLNYDVSVVDHGTGRVTVTLTIADEGRLKPLDSVDLAIPGQDKNKDGSHWMDLVVSVDARKEDGKSTARVHINKELAKRAEIHLKTSNLDGKQLALTWYYHVIPISKYLKNGEQKKD